MSRGPLVPRLITAQRRGESFEPPAERAPHRIRKENFR